MSTHKIHVLSNGLRIVHERFKGNDIAHCGITINVGTRNEADNEWGIAHYIEHVLFKGTKTRKSFHILNRIEVVGGELNAYTTKEETCVYASFPVQHFERAIELLSDIVNNSVFPEKELEKEKEVIIDEINSYQDNPYEQIYDDFEEQLFANHPLGHPILGTIDSVKKLKREDILAFIKKHYKPEQIVFSSVGDVDFNKVVKLSEKYFGHLVNDGIEAINTKEQVKYLPRKINLKKDTHQAHCVIGNVAYSLSEEKRTGLLLLNNLLGGPGMNSRLNMSIREKHGIAYNIYSNYTPYIDTGIFNIYIGTDNDNIEKSIKLTYKELRKLREEKLSVILLKQAKQQLVGQIAMAQESKASLMLGFGKSMLTYNKVDTLKEVYQKINALSAENLLEIANEVFDEGQMSMLLFEC
jgi:predicted Zn-dependent peptidase